MLKPILRKVAYRGRKFVPETFLDDLYEVVLDWAEPYVFRQFKSNGYYPDTIIDVGAFEGFWTQRLARIFPESRFILIDALELNRDQLESLDVEDKSVHIAVLSYDRGIEKEFYQSGAASSYYEDKSGEVENIETKETTTLDDIVGEQETGEILLKLDVQGAELDVLRGASDTLDQVTFIYLETSLVEFNEGAPEFSQIVEGLYDLGYELYDVSTQHREGARLIQLDVLFVDEDIERVDDW